MEIQHLSHKHPLTFYMPSVEEDDDDEEPQRCWGCVSYIHGPAFTCQDCKFWLHKSCGELPREIEKHPFHSAHSLFLRYALEDDEEYRFKCDGCQQLCFGLKYFCKWCRFFLGITCACSTYEEVEASKGAQIKTTISHFSHRHELTWCRAGEEMTIECAACKEVVLGAAYVCIPCSFVLHESCLNDMPQEVEHLFHPQHHLRPQHLDDDDFGLTCNACYEDIMGIVFKCDDCSFYLHASCVKFKTRAIKHPLHEHELLYFGQRHIGRCRKCLSCGEDCSTSFFCCVVCDVDVHLECLPLPLIVKHNRHFHPLTLRDSVEDDLGQYYCDICETERNSEHHIYYCEECNYTAHIDCVVCQIEPPEKILSYLIPRCKLEPNPEKIENSSKTIYPEQEDESHTCISVGELGLVMSNQADNDVGEYNAAEKNNLKEAASDLELRDAEQFGKAEEAEDLVDTTKNLQKEVEELITRLIQVKLHFSHKHTLIFCMLSDQKFYRCMGCGSQIHGPAYTCEELCDFHMHKSCGELPREIEKHPLHPAHPLLLQNFDPNTMDCRIYNGCQQVFGGQKYICSKWCRFSLDIKCAFLSDEEALALKGRDHVKTTIMHFSHQHHLTRFSMTDKLKESCNGCEKPISGPTYACLLCPFFLHESCFIDMPQEVETPFHPQHHLVPQLMKVFKYRTCNACHERISGINFSCDDCSFYLHASCVKYKTRAIKHKFHEHELLYFGPKNIGRSSKCYSCGEDCSASFFCCVACDVDIHLECLPLPLIVKHNRHFHPLTLRDSIEDDLGQYYCDICETERNPEHHIYYCEECNYTTHIDCVISQVEPPEEILSYLIPRNEKVALEQENDEAKSEINDSEAKEEWKREELVHSDPEKGVENLQEEEEGLIGRLELAQAKLKKRTQKLLDLIGKEKFKLACSREGNMKAKTKCKSHSNYFDWM